jgi:hypothetical protein
VLARVRRLCRGGRRARQAGTGINASIPCDRGACFAPHARTGCAPHRYPVARPGPDIGPDFVHNFVRDIAYDFAHGIAYDFTHGIAYDIAHGIAYDIAHGIAYDFAHDIAHDIAHGFAGGHASTPGRDADPACRPAPGRRRAAAGYGRVACLPDSGRSR